MPDSETRAEVSGTAGYFEPVRDTTVELAGRTLPARWKCDLVQKADVWAAQWACVPMENGHNVVIVGPDHTGESNSRWAAHLFPNDVEVHDWLASKRQINARGNCMWFADDAALLKQILEWSALPGGRRTGRVFG